VEDLLYSSFDTDSPVTLAFHEQQRRHVLYFCLRWENNIGEKGPYGEIYSATIP
jgi:hypothetical protein